jgi:hypothetical protein
MAQAMNRSALESALGALGEVLAQRGLAYEVVLVGGGNLLLRGIISRPTKDGDLLGQRLEDGRIVQIRRLPDGLSRAVADVASAYGLAGDWLNIGPEALLELGLPPGFAERLSRRDFGALTIWVAGTYDLICFKLYAAADHWPTRDRHLADLRALKPRRAQLLSAALWTRTHDSSPDFRTLLVAVLADLGVADADVALR